MASDEVPQLNKRPANNLAMSSYTAVIRRKFARKINVHDRFARTFDGSVFWPLSQLLTGHSRNLRGLLANALAVTCIGVACGRTPAPGGTGNATSTNVAAPARGGELLVSIRTEPQSFSRFAHADATTDLVNYLTQARLVRINRNTFEVEPWLAESWTRSADGLSYTVKLRPNVTFSDGHPFTSADVEFSLALAYDVKGGGPIIGEGLEVGGKPIKAVAPDPLTVVITFPAVYAPGMRIFDDLPIVPKHKLEAALKAGTFTEAWSLSASLTDIAGLGPFVISSYQPGQRLVFARNERYFRRDASGIQLPYLDRIILDIVPDQSAQMLRLEAGQSDMLADEVRQEDYSRLKRAADAGRVQLFDLGVSLAPDSFWFNLKAGAFAKDPRSGWIQRDELRRAISLAVDRKAYLDTVSLGAGVPVFGLITPASRKWYSPEVPQTPHDPARARQLLASIGLTDRNGDGLLEDARGTPARFSISTQKGRTAFERGAVVIRDELKKIGVTVDVALLEGNALVGRLASGQGYDAALFQLGVTDPEPATQLALWLSSGPFHVWNSGAKTPTPWEKQIDDLMARQISTLDEAERQRLFVEVQKIFAEHLPILNFAAPTIFAATSSRVANLTPSVVRPQFLWAADTIAIKR